MQKFFNLLGTLGFLMSGVLVGATIVAFARVPGMIEDYLEDVTGDVIGEVTEVIPEQIEQAMPELPKVTGPAIPSFK